MKPTRQRARLPVQTDLFDCASPVPALTGLQLHHDELVGLMSQLLWEVVSDAGKTRGVENGDEQN